MVQKSWRQAVRSPAVNSETISWYALRVAPQSELRVRNVLQQREHPAVVPVETVWRERDRKPGKPKATTKKVRPVFPGYVFVGLPSCRPVEEAARERAWINEREGRPVVHGLIGFGVGGRGKPCVLSPADVETVMTLSDRLAQPAPAEGFSIGDNAKFKDGHAYGRWVGPVVKIRGRDRARVSVMLKVFGQMRVVETGIENLVAA